MFLIVRIINIKIQDKFFLFVLNFIWFYILLQKLFLLFREPGRNHVFPMGDISKSGVLSAKNLLLAHVFLLPEQRIPSRLARVCMKLG